MVKRVRDIPSIVIIWIVEEVEGIATPTLHTFFIILALIFLENLRSENHAIKVGLFSPQIMIYKLMELIFNKLDRNNYLWN